VDSSFFTEFLYLTDFRTVIFIGILIGLFFMMYRLEKKGVNFSRRMLLATAIGLMLGVSIQAIAGFPSSPLEVRFIAEIETWYGLIANGFMSLLRMLIVPLVFVSMIRIIVTMEQGVSLKKLTFRTIGMLVATTTLAALVGIMAGQLFQVGVNTTLIEGDLVIFEAEPIVSTLLGLLPANPIAAMANGDVVPVIIFAVFIGTAIKRQMKKSLSVVKPFIDLVEAFYTIIFGVSMTVIKWMPYAIVALLANTIVGRGLAVIREVIGFTSAIYVSFIIMFFIHLLIIALNGLNPIRYLQNVTDVLILAFTSRSSLGTLPVSIEKLTTQVGLNQGTATFVGSLGANGGMNGSAGVYPALVAVMLANMIGRPIDLTFIIMLMIVIASASFGIAGIPGAATVAVSIVLAGVGLGELFPLIAAIVAIDPILDMGRTFLNVNGTLVTAVTVGKSLNQIDEEIYDQQLKHKPSKAPTA